MLARRWMLPVVLGVVGAVLGGLGGMITPPAAEVRMMVNIGQVDAQYMSRIAETTVQEISSDAVFAQAASTLGGDTDPEDLAERTRVSADQGSYAIVVRVSAPTTEQAILEADAIAAAVSEVEEEIRQAELEQVDAALRELMTASGTNLAVPLAAQAEQARIARLATALAETQASLATQQSTLRVIQPAREATNGPSAAVLAVVCGVGGALVGAGIVLLRGERGRVKSLSELSSIYPHLPVASIDMVSDLLELEGPDIGLVLVSSPLTASSQSRALTDQVTAILDADGNHGWKVQVLSAPLNQGVVRRVQRDESALLLVAVDPARLRIQELGGLLDQVTERVYLVELSGSRG